jgi:small-conductance mechanosensitive channel
MIKKLEDVFQLLLNWVQTNLLTWDMASQWLCVVGVLLMILVFWGRIESRLKKAVSEQSFGEMFGSILSALVGIGNLVVFFILVQICAAVFKNIDMAQGVLVAVSDLALAGIAIRLLAGMLPNKTLARIAATTIWILAALHVFGILPFITNFLSGLSFSTGQSTFTALGVIKGVLLAAICLQGANIVSQFAVRRIELAEDISPSLQVLMTKAVKGLLFTTALLFAMSSVGIDLTSLAIFSSALGVGIGFGLKTIFSNYVAGVLLLMDSSIKPGDTIEVGDVFGVVHEMHGRYTSVLTRDGKEHLVPNENFVVNEVINWTYSDTNIRLKLPVGISYSSDVDKAMELLKKAAIGVERVLANPSPAARLVGFGDNSVDLQLRLWISDANKGITNVRSEVLVNIWNLFHENNIEFPFPQRDVLLKAESALKVKIEKDDGE